MCVPPRPAPPPPPSRCAPPALAAAVAAVAAMCLLPLALRAGGYLGRTAAAAALRAWGLLACDFIVFCVCVCVLSALLRPPRDGAVMTVAGYHLGVLPPPRPTSPVTRAARTLPPRSPPWMYVHRLTTAATPPLCFPPARTPRGATRVRPVRPPRCPPAPTWPSRLASRHRRRQRGHAVASSVRAARGGDRVGPRPSDEGSKGTYQGRVRPGGVSATAWAG